MQIVLGPRFSLLNKVLSVVPGGTRFGVGGRFSRACPGLIKCVLGRRFLAQWVSSARLIRTNLVVLSCGSKLSGLTISGKLEKLDTRGS